MAKFLINGVEVIFQDTDENINLLRTDDDFTKSYLQSTLESGSLKEFNIYEGNVNKLQVERVTETETTGSNECFKWSDNLTKLLLNFRLKEASAFNRPSCRKRKLWELIAQEISKSACVPVTGEACDRKFRNLLTTYRSNKKKQGKTDEESINWEYFSLMDEILGHNSPSSPHPELLEGNLMEDEDTSSSSLSSVSTSTNQSESNHRPMMEIPSSAIKRKFSVSDYLQEKLKLLAEREKRRERMEREKMRLKEREIDAILELAKAISGKRHKRLNKSK